jgi:hypothetical protein
MDSHKLEPRLANLVEERRAGATERGLTVADVEGEPISVTISHEEWVRAEEGQDPERHIASLGGRGATKSGTDHVQAGGARSG